MSDNTTHPSGASVHANLRRGAAATIAVLASVLAVPTAGAQTTSTAPAAAADAYALDINGRATSLNVAVDSGPHARSSQEYPPQGEVDTAAVFSTGQIPAGSGAAVQNIGLLQSAAGANSQPLASAVAQAADVQLINQAGTPLITATLLKAVSTTECDEAPSAEGTEIAGLKIGTLDISPDQPPNTPVGDAVLNPLGLRAIVNEQRQAADGRGLVVNALHVFNYQSPSLPAPVTPLFIGDIIVAHAMSTVNCPNGAGSTGGDNAVFIVKNADKAKAKAGDTITYTATVQNKSAEPCLVNQLIDHLPVAFEFTSTSGDFGTSADVVARPVGGSDVVIKPTNITIPAGGSGTQTYVVTVKADAQPGTYFNNVEILCSNLGNWIKGLDAPVEVVTDDDEPPPPPPDKKQCEDGKDNDGDGKIDFPADPGCFGPKDDNEVNEHPRTGGSDEAALLGVLLLAAAYGLRRRLA